MHAAVSLIFTCKKIYQYENGKNEAKNYLMPVKSPPKKVIAILSLKRL